MDVLSFEFNKMPDKAEVEKNALKGSISPVCLCAAFKCPGVNFINIKLARFSYERHFGSFFSYM